MTNETFGMTFQNAICERYNLAHPIQPHRIDQELKQRILASGVIDDIFGAVTPVEYLTFSEEFTSETILRCPHNFRLANGETFSIRTFMGKNKMFAPKVVGQAGEATFNYFFGDIAGYPINRSNFKAFCLEKVHEILPVLIDYALISDLTCWVYAEPDGSYKHFTLRRADLPELTFERKDFSFTNESVETWNESSTAKYLGTSLIEFQMHTNRSGFKIRLHRDNFPEILKLEQNFNNSVIGDSAELAICRTFQLDPGIDNNRLVSNSNSVVVRRFQRHYEINKTELFPLPPVRYGGSGTRDRGGASKSGIDFYLENNLQLSVKTNKTKVAKVCPPEIGQPAPATFDHYFADRGWYEGAMNKMKFKELVRDKEKLAELLSEYLQHLNECDYLLWSIYNDGSNIVSRVIPRAFFEGYAFDASHISYSNDFIEKDSVTIRYGELPVSLGEFQIHSARNSLKFRFNFGNLLSLCR